MASAVPGGFLDLYTASTRINVDVNIMGVVTDFLPPSKSKGTDWMCTFSVADLTLGNHREGLTIRFFKAMESELPLVQGTGDVIILRNVKVKPWSGMTIAVSNYATTWTVFPESSIPKKAASKIQLKYVKESRASAPSFAEMQYAILLCNSNDRTSYNKILTAPSHISNTSGTHGSPDQVQPSETRRDKFSLIKDVQLDNFHDLVGQVVKIYPSNGCVELYITDYTSNSSLFNYQWGFPIEGGRDVDEFGYIRRNSTNRQWPGPFGQHTLTVTLWPPHAYLARTNVKEKDFVFLRNVRIRNSRDSKTEGSIHTDQRYVDRVDVSVLTDHRNDERVKNILRRKREYTEKFRAQSRTFVNESRLQKRKQEEEKPFSKGQRKKRKQQNEQALKSNRREKENSNQDESKNAKLEPLVKSTKSELNKNIKCSHDSFPPRSLSSILSFDTHAITTPNGTACTLPFQNIKSRALVRVIDFFPSKLADFAVPRRPVSEYDALSEVEDDDSEQEESDSVDQERPWEWRFGLVLEDAMGSGNEKKTAMTVYVADQDADFLLRLDAQNLHTSPQTLALLREKLFLLWGDLEERKSASLKPPLQPKSPNQQPAEIPKSKPFQCCLMEYGIRNLRRREGEGEGEGYGDGEWDGFGWERRWRMWGTTIV